MSVSYSKNSIGMLFFIMAFIITMYLMTLDFGSVYAQKGSEVVIKKENIDEKNKLVVVSNINLQNIPKVGMLKVVGVINGEGFIKTISLDEIDETKKKLSVKFVMNKDNEFVSASKPDEFFVCAYHLEEMTEDYNSLPPYFDCDEGDLAGSDATTISRLFGPQSLVYDKTAYHYLNNPSHQESFAAMDDDYIEDDSYGPIEDDSYGPIEDDRYAITNFPSKNNVKRYQNIENSINTREENTDSSDSNDDNQPVKVKIIVPMQDKKNAEKIKIMTMLKGQIKYTVIEDVQKEFDKIGGYTIERTFDFDRNTDLGPIQIGDRFHACVIGEDLNPPEGSECEKKLIKHLDRPNSLAVR
ncbi:MAG TPA: hypothetical protein VFM31_08985 [Nitrososphaeraceae archaeon]|nr:hypothetical protein [Nitrososphaeraceae archaeon]